MIGTPHTLQPVRREERQPGKQLGESTSGSPVRRASAGFTLIELLVAMFLLAVLGTAGFQMLFQINTARERIELQSDRLNALQRTFYWLAEDVTQIIDRPIRSAIDAELPGLQYNLEGENLFELTRSGWANPAADVAPPRSSLERVAWRLDEDRLLRRYWYQLESLNEEPTKTRQLLTGVESLTLRFLDREGEWQEEWPPVDEQRPGIMPLAIEFIFELKDMGTVTRLFGLPS